ncbi:MAG: ABC transporter ATP-binding protein [Pseudomonadota bacterium]
MTSPEIAPVRFEVKHLTRRFGGRAVVDDISFSVRAGEVMCLLGPSGCGKSTALRCIAGVDRQDAGEVYVEGALISDGRYEMPPEQRPIGLMFQDFALFPHLTVEQNVAYGLHRRGTDTKGRVAHMLDRVHLRHKAKSYPHEISGGEQQRVALARSLAPKPRIVLMDEPFSGLDNRLRDGIRDETLEVLKEEGAAVLLVTHEPEEAMRMADEIALMRDGKIIQTGSPYNVYNAPVDKAAAAFFSEINVLRGQVKGALTETPFGPFLAPGVPDGGMVEIVIRPQDLKIDFDRQGKGPNTTVDYGQAARGVVERARYLGSESLVEFRMDHDGSVLTAVVPSIFLPQIGTPLWLMFRRAKCFVFPAA